MSNHPQGPWTITDSGKTIAGPENGFEPIGACGCCDSPWIYGWDPRSDVAQQIVVARILSAAPVMLEALIFAADHADIMPTVVLERINAAIRIAKDGAFFQGE